MKTKTLLLGLLIFFAVNVFSQTNTYTGNITEVNHPVAKFLGSDGTAYQIMMGPYWFWADKGYKLLLESATIKGELSVNNGINTIYPYEITQNGTTIKLKDDKGISLWSGNKGNGNGKGNCWRNGNGNGNGRGKGNCWGNGNGNGRGRGNNPNCPYNKTK